jgi:hypothetical protein
MIARLAVALAGSALIASVGWAGDGSATPAGTGSASDTVSSLEAQGYTVQLNGAGTPTLSLCTVSGVHPTVIGPADPARATTVYVDVSCPPIG